MEPANGKISVAQPRARIPGDAEMLRVSWLPEFTLFSRFPWFLTSRLPIPRPRELAGIGVNTHILLGGDFTECVRKSVRHCGYNGGSLLFSPFCLVVTACIERPLLCTDERLQCDAACTRVYAWLPVIPQERFPFPAFLTLPCFVPCSGAPSPGIPSKATTAPSLLPAAACGPAFT